MERIQRIEELLQQIESSADPGTRAGVRELVEAILEYHGAGLGRILEIAGESGAREFARDPLVASLLLLYGLHPEDFETRVRRAVDALPGVLLLGADEGIVRLRATSSDTSREAVEQALYSAAPEITVIDIEGLHPPSFVPLEALQRAS
jgi:hypothetical protein